MAGARSPRPSRSAGTLSAAEPQDEAGGGWDVTRQVVWANSSLRDPTEFDTFNEEWVRWFPGETPIGQGTLMPPLKRRAGFRISIGVIAEA